jgi:hypothetical protein
MSMTRKHFVAFAQIIAAEVAEANELTPVRRNAALRTLRSTARAMAREFAYDNRNFDRARFMDACGLGDPNGN